MQRPERFVLLYEDIDRWCADHPAPLAREKVRTLACRKEIQYSIALVEEAGFSHELICLNDTRPERLLSVLAEPCRQILWNLTDGIDEFQGSKIPALAELFGIPYLGSSSYVQALTLNKPHWKSVLRGAGVPVLDWMVVHKLDEYERAGVRALTPPYFVKPAAIGNNAGIEYIKPVCYTPEEALEQAAKLIRGGISPVMVEQFIDGPEFDVWLCDVDGWKANTTKKSYRGSYLNTYIKDRRDGVGVVHSTTINRELVELAGRCVDILGIRDFVRIEFRHDRDGNPYPIDVNATPFLINRSLDNFLYAHDLDLVSVFHSMAIRKMHEARPESGEGANQIAEVI